MKYYLMAEKAHADGTIIYQDSHFSTIFSQGIKLLDYEHDDETGEPFVGPLACLLDDEYPDGKMSTFFTSPAIVVKKQFYNDLLEIGIDNIEVFPVIIRDEVNDKLIEDYLLLNIIGRISCADIDSTEYRTLDEGEENMTFIDRLVLDHSKVKCFDIFLVSEDTDCIVINEKVYKHLVSKRYTDIYFEELEII